MVMWAVRKYCCPGLERLDEESQRQRLGLKSRRRGAEQASVRSGVWGGGHGRNHKKIIGKPSESHSKMMVYCWLRQQTWGLDGICSGSMIVQFVNIFPTSLCRTCNLKFCYSWGFSNPINITGGLDIARMMYEEVPSVGHRHDLQGGSGQLCLLLYNRPQICG